MNRISRPLSRTPPTQGSISAIPVQFCAKCSSRAATGNVCGDRAVGGGRLGGSGSESEFCGRCVGLGLAVVRLTFGVPLSPSGTSPVTTAPTAGSPAKGRRVCRCLFRVVVVVAATARLCAATLDVKVKHQWVCRPPLLAAFRNLRIEKFLPPDGETSQFILLVTFERRTL